MYLLKASAFSDQLAHCAVDGVCYVRNDDGVRPFKGRVVVSVTALRTGTETVLSDRTVAIARGPGVVQWLCAIDANASAGLSSPSAVAGNSGMDRDRGNGSYTRFVREIPTDRANYTGPHAATLAACEATCDKQSTCVGFTRTNKPDSAITDCFFYSSVPSLNGAAPGASYWSKPGEPVPAHPPTPPPPPPLPPPPPAVPMPHCTAFASQMARLGCDASGSDCVLSVHVVNHAGTIVSRNENSFVAPKLITGLHKAALSLSIGEWNASSGAVPITVSSAHTALWVTLSTLAQGRFSDGAFLLHAGKPKGVDFVAWGSDTGSTVVAELGRSLRAESLSSYLPAVESAS